MPGPIFAQVMLADEINRTPPRTQAALLEAMQEAQVTIAGVRHLLEPPLFVLATENPIEQEGTYPLPEAQLDRFMLNIVMGYPTAADERAIVAATTGNDEPDVTPVAGAAELLRARRLVREVPGRRQRHRLRDATGARDTARRRRACRRPWAAGSAGGPARAPASRWCSPPRRGP